MFSNYHRILASYMETWKSTGKSLRVTDKDKMVELKEDRSLFARMMMVCKSRLEIGIETGVGQYECSIVPRSMFASNGTMRHCSSRGRFCEGGCKKKHRQYHRTESACL